MWLIQVRERLGKSRDAKPGIVFDPQVTMRGFATRVALAQGILELKAMADAYNRHFTQTAVEYSVVGATEIHDMTAEELEAGDIELIDDWQSRTAYAS